MLNRRFEGKVLLCCPWVGGPGPGLKKSASISKKFLNIFFSMAADPELLFFFF